MIKSLETRNRILTSIEKGMHLTGYNALRTDKVIQQLGITKGAFYHYFPDKIAAGYAVVDEILAPDSLAGWTGMQEDGPALEAICGRIERIKTGCVEQFLYLGCHVNNLIQEMSPTNEGFRERLEKLILGQIHLIEHCLKQGQLLGQVGQQVDCHYAAIYIMTSIEGASSMGKIMRSKPIYDASMDTLKGYVRGLA